MLYLKFFPVKKHEAYLNLSMHTSNHNIYETQSIFDFQQVSFKFTVVTLYKMFLVKVQVTPVLGSVIKTITI